VLVADDEPPIRLLCQVNLAVAGMEVLQAADGAEALALTRAEKPDLVLLDLMMPKLNGYEFIDQVGRLEMKRPHIIVFTAAGKRGVDKIQPDSICASILKPFDLEKFIELIGECLDHDGMPHQSSQA